MPHAFPITTDDHCRGRRVRHQVFIAWIGQKRNIASKRFRQCGKRADFRVSRAFHHAANPGGQISYSPFHFGKFADVFVEVKERITPGTASSSLGGR